MKTAILSDRGDTADGRYAIKWSLVPEPTTQVLLLVGGAGIVVCRPTPPCRNLMPPVYTYP